MACQPTLSPTLSPAAAYPPTSAAAAPRRVFAQEPGGRVFGYGTLVAIDQWGGWPIAYTVRLDTGAELRARPQWLTFDPIEAPQGNVVPFRRPATGIANWAADLFRDAALPEGAA